MKRRTKHLVFWGLVIGFGMGYLMKKRLDETFSEMDFDFSDNIYEDDFLTPEGRDKAYEKMMRKHKRPGDRAVM